MAQADRRPQILVIEDDKTLNHLLLEQLESLGYESRGAMSRAETVEILKEFTPSLAILDLRLPDADGLTFLPELREYCAVMVLTAYGSIDQAVSAIKNGACEFLVKPVSPQGLELALDRVLETAALKRDLAFWQEKAQRDTQFNLIGDSPEMAELRQMVSMFAAAQSPVLIFGESGVGKGFVAGAIHAQSPRSNGRFIAVDCDSDLDAADLFGCDTGHADNRREGLIAAAENGTIFLNDIDRLEDPLQAKLLRVMETDLYRPLGATSSRPCGARFLVATSLELEDMAKASQFRSELFYRLSAFTISVPPLRQRKGDILPLAEYFLETRNFHRGVQKTLAPESREALKNYDWPGNLRELRNTIERGVIMSAGAELITPEHLAIPDHSSGLPSSASSAGVSLRFDHQPTLEEIRDTYVRLLLQTYGGNRQSVAKALGMSERNTYRLLKKIGDISVD